MTVIPVLMLVIMCTGCRVDGDWDLGWTIVISGGSSTDIQLFFKWHMSEIQNWGHRQRSEICGALS